MLLKIAQLGQPVLRKAASPVAVDMIATAEFQEFLRDMAETLQQDQGVGLAAPQVFASDRVFLAAILPSAGPDDEPGVEAIINPTLTALTAEKVQAWEGCLSFPELLVLVPRYRSVRVDYLNAAGQPSALLLHDLAARIVQHEYDHLDGILTIDRAASTRDIIKASEIDTVIGESGEPA